MSHDKRQGAVVVRIQIRLWPGVDDDLIHQLTLDARNKRSRAQIATRLMQRGLQSQAARNEPTTLPRVSEAPLVMNAQHGLALALPDEISEVGKATNGLREFLGD